MAPEVFMGEQYNFAIDAFSFAVLIYWRFKAPTHFDNGKRVQNPAFILFCEVNGGAHFARVPEIREALWALIESWHQ
jgi:hypothetical protein